MRSHVKHARILRNRSSATAVVMVVALVATVVSILTDHTARGQEAGAVVGEVRIAAQRQEDGVVRFGLRAPDGSGGWTQAVRPRAHRFDPADASTGSWLVSSQLILEVDDAGRGRLVRSDQFEPFAGGETTLVSGLEGWYGDARYSAFHDEGGDLVTSASLYSASVGTPDGELRTTITCQDGETSVRIGGVPSSLGDATTTSQVPVSWSVDHGTRHTERWPVTPAATGLELVEGTEDGLARALLGYGSQLALTIGGTANLTSAIDLDELRALPVYDNLRHCGGDIMPSAHTELRIRAQVRADERIEFAVQQRTADGWSDNILPRARTITAFGDATNWLSSTPVSVQVERDAQRNLILPELVVRETPEPITPVLRGGYRTESLVYGVYSQDHEGYDPTKLTTIVAVNSEQGTQLQVACLGDERRVILAGALFEATGDLTLSFDDTQLIAKWDVALSANLASLSPDDSERTMQRLRQAQTLSVSFGDGGYDPLTYDLVDFFETPVQANIDQCGNYAAPEWQPIVTRQHVQNEAGEYYFVSYPDSSENLRVSQIRNRAIEGTPATGVELIHLVMTCDKGGLSFVVWGLPGSVTEQSIRLQVDDGEWIQEPVELFTHPDGSKTAEFTANLGRLKGGGTLRFELGLEQPVHGSFDLASLLDTPIQTNFDNCGKAYWSTARTYVPILGRTERISRTVRYFTLPQDDGTIYTGVTATAVDAPQVDGAIVFGAHCLDGDTLQLQVNVPTAVPAGSADVTLIIDDLPPLTSTWSTSRSTTGGGSLYPPSHGRLMSRLREASVFTLHAPNVTAEPIVFHLEGMFQSPVQENLDECGFYRPGEVRTLPLPLNVYGSTHAIDEERNLRVLRFWQRTPARTMPAVTLMELHSREGATLIGLAITCSDHGVRVSIIGRIVRSLTGDRVELEWRPGTSPASTHRPTSVRPRRAS